VAFGAAAVLWLEVEAATSNHSVGSSDRADRVGRWAFGIIAVPISTPFPHVSVHVMESPCVGFFLAHRPRAATIALQDFEILV